MNDFNGILGRYTNLPVIRHDTDAQKSYAFLGDHWEEMGDIELVFIQVTEGTGYMQIQLPNPKKFVADHEDEGAKDWLVWGPRLN